MPSPSAPTPPPPGVRIVPLPGTDLGSRQSVIQKGLIIGARLDPKKLETALTLLIEKTLPRAGARLVLRNGVYEFHIPNTFDAQTPAIGFTASDYAEPYATPSSGRPSFQHLLSRSSTSSDEPWIGPMPTLAPYLRSDSVPTSFAGYLAPNTPVLHIHVSVFTDITLIGMNFTHTAFDLGSTMMVLHGWAAVLAGKPLDELPHAPWDLMPFASFASPSPETVRVIPRGWLQLGLFAKILFIFYSLLRILVLEPKTEYKAVRIPKAFLEKKKDEIMAELKADGSSEWVGSSDVLNAWWYKTTYSHRTDSTPQHLHLAMNLRESPLFPDPSDGTRKTLTTPYLNNAVCTIPCAPLSAKQMGTMSMRELALFFRRNINTYRADHAGLLADLTWRCTHPFVTLYPCPPGAEFQVQSNWRQAEFGRLDFSGAIADSELGGEKGDRKAPLLFLLCPPTGRVMFRGNGTVLFEDEEAVWMGQNRGSKDWEQIRRAGQIKFI